MIRILIIEDNEKRIDLFKQWMPADVRAVFVRSAGRAIHVIELDKGSVYAGVCLDHDLDEQVTLREERGLNGVEVVRRIVRNLSLDAPILVHSMNYSGGTSMVRMLQAQGFAVTRVPFVQMEEIVFLNWIDNVRAEWEYSRARGDRQ